MKNSLVFQFVPTKWKTTSFSVSQFVAAICKTASFFNLQQQNKQRPRFSICSYCTLFRLVTGAVERLGSRSENWASCDLGVNRFLAERVACARFPFPLSLGDCIARCPIGRLEVGEGTGLRPEAEAGGSLFSKRVTEARGSLVGKWVARSLTGALAGGSSACGSISSSRLWSRNP